MVSDSGKLVIGPGLILFAGPAVLGCSRPISLLMKIERPCGDRQGKMTLVHIQLMHTICIPCCCTGEDGEGKVGQLNAGSFLHSFLGRNAVGPRPRVIPVPTRHRFPIRCFVGGRSLLMTL